MIHVANVSAYETTEALAARGWGLASSALAGDADASFLLHREGA